MNSEERARLLKQAGMLRFEQKTDIFVEQLHTIVPEGSLNLYDTCLIPAIAEGLGYGRSRDFFRSAGLYLLGVVQHIPQPLGHTPNPPPLDAQRLRALRRLVAQWHTSGLWQPLRNILLSGNPAQINNLCDAVRTVFADLSPARADILICNVVLPFAVAIGLIESDPQLIERVQMLYQAHPGLPSNRITRMMYRQLQLESEPSGSCQQQGLQYIYQQTCREKHCDGCIAGRTIL